MRAALVYSIMQVVKSNAIQSEINMTPMIDVLLVLIIIFMVIAPVRTKGLEAIAPKESKDTRAVDDSSAVVVIAGDGSLRFNHNIVSLEEMTRLLRGVAPLPVFVQGDGGLAYQDVARVVDAIRGAGVSQIGLLRGL